MASPRPAILQENWSKAEKGSGGKHPMNAFLIFCKRERGSVRRQYPFLENREVSRVLGEWWASLAPPDKAVYTARANQHKENLDRTPVGRILNKGKMVGGKGRKLPANSPPAIIPGKLADESQLGGLSSLLLSVEKTFIQNEEATRQESKPPLAIPLKKRYRDGLYLTQDVQPVPLVPKEVKEEKTERASPTNDTSEEEERLKMWRSHILEENNNVKDRKDRACKGQRYREFMWNNYTNLRRTNRWELNQDKIESSPPAKQQKTAKTENKSSKISSSSSEEKADSSRENLSSEPQRNVHKKIFKKKSTKSERTSENSESNGSDFQSIPESINSFESALSELCPDVIGEPMNCDNVALGRKPETPPTEANNNTPLPNHGKTKKSEEIIVTGSRKRKVRKQVIRRLTPGSTFNDIVV